VDGVGSDALSLKYFQDRSHPVTEGFGVGDVDEREHGDASFRQEEGMR
jgi:hypothetical protein